ncbi:MAG: hypothetical protein ACRDNF_01435 [Streptosporangiaceae bacterium]
MTQAAAATVSAPVDYARRLKGLRRASLAALLMLIVQFALGVGVNLYVSLPAAGSGGRKVSQAFTNGPTLALHVVLGLLLLLAAIGLLVQAITAGHGRVIALASVGLLAIAGAAFQGFSFVHKSTNAASMGMTVATAVAMLCYVATLFIARAPEAGQGR